MAISILPETAVQPRLSSWSSGEVKWRRIAVVGILALYLFSVSAQWFIESDSALYLMLAKNLAGGEGYTLWNAPHAHVPPGYPLFLAGLMQLGLGDYFWLNLSNVLMIFAILGLSYRYVAEQTSSQFGLLVCAVVAFSHEMHTASLILLSDLPFMLMVWIGLYCYIRGLKQSGPWLEIGTLALIACCWVRVAGFPLAGAAAIGLALNERQVPRRRVWLNALVLLAGVGLTCLLFYKYHQRVTAAYTVQTYSGYVSEMVQRSDWEWLTAPIGNVLATGRGILRLLTGQQHNSLSRAAVALVWIPVVAGMALALRRRRTLGPSCVAGYVLVLTLNHLLMARYLLPLFPLLVWYFYDGAQWIVERLPRCRRYAARTTWVLTVVLLAFNLPHAITYAFYARQPEAYRRYAQWEGLQEAAQFLRQHGEPSDRFVSSSHPREISYLSGMWPARLTTYHFNCCPPSVAQYQHWRERGMTFVIEWHGLAPSSVETLEHFCRDNGYRRVFTGSRCKIYYSPRAGRAGEESPPEASPALARVEREW